jgi:hypothetical protein
LYPSKVGGIGIRDIYGRKGWDSNPRRQENCLYALAKRRFQPTQPPFLIAALGEIGTYDGGKNYGV